MLLLALSLFLCLFLWLKAPYRQQWTLEGNENSAFKVQEGNYFHPAIHTQPIRQPGRGVEAVSDIQRLTQFPCTPLSECALYKNEESTQLLRVLLTRN